MVLLNLADCDNREFDVKKGEIFCKKYGCIKLVEDCLECQMDLVS